MSTTYEPSDTAPGAGEERPSPAVACALIADLVDVLLPGDDAWPSGATVGVQAALVLRLLQEHGADAIADLVHAVLAAGGPMRGLDGPGRVAVVERFEGSEPKLFGRVRDAAYVTYYESPFVAEVINARGTSYDLRPHLRGYPLPRFDNERHTPRHGRGRFTPTDQVRPVDVSGLDLASDRTQRWGIKR